MKPTDNNFQLDPEKSWSKIEPQLERHFREKRKRRFLWLFSFGLFMVISAGIAYYGYAPELVRKNEVVQRQMQSTELPATVANEKSTVKSSAEIIVAEPAAAPSTEAQAIGQITNSPKKLKGKTAATPPKQSAGSTAAVADKKNNINAQVDSRAPLPIPPVALNSSEPVIAPSVGLNDQVAQVVQTTTKVAAETFVLETNSVLAPAALNATSRATILVDSVSATPAITKSTDTIPSQQIPLLLLPERKWYVDVYGGVFQVSKRLQAPYPDWVERRFGEEENALGTSWGISVSTSRSSWSFSAGLEYVRYGERTRYSPFSYQEVTRDSLLWSYLFDATDTFYVTGNQVFLLDLTPNLIDSVSTTVTDTVVQFAADESIAARNGRVYWNYFEIPVAVGYAWRIGKWDVGVQGAIVPALLQRTSGYYVSTDETGLLVADKIAAVSRFVVGARLGFSIGYAINNRWTLHFDPQWRRQLTSVYDDKKIDQRYTAVGATIGMRVLLK